MAVKKEVDNQIREVIEEMLGVGSGVSLQYGRLEKAGARYGRPSGRGERILMNEALLDDDIMDILYRAAHESGHARHHRQVGDEGYNMASRRRKEYIADKEAMKYFKSKGYKLGPKARSFAESSHPESGRFKRQAGKAGLFRILMDLIKK